MKELILFSGERTTVDDADYERLKEYSYYLHNRGYAARKQGNKTIFLHQDIMQPCSGQKVDHEDQNRLNNCRYNLRLCTNAQNLMNRPKQRNNTTGYKGVFKRDAKTGWRAQIRVAGKSIHLGSFQTPELAAIAYNEAATQHFGEFAQLNDVR